MNKTFEKSLFIFRRDLRLEDNLGLMQLLAQSKAVVPAFMFDPRQIDRAQNEYFSEPAFQFLLNSLAELNESLVSLGSRLYIFHGEPEKITESLIKDDGIQAVFVSKDYTPFARRRDKAIEDICKESGVVFTRCDDGTLSPIEEVRTQQGKLYTVFTPFMKKAHTYDVPQPKKNTHNNFYDKELKTPTRELNEFEANTAGMSLALAGGRKEALRIMQNPSFLDAYTENRNVPSLENGTSRLSAHHKFGTISIRESYHMAIAHAGKNSQYISELYWRDFYYYTAYHFPLVFKGSFLQWAQYIEWINDEKQFEAWCMGMTGVPMVDAGMRELNSTGFMHNRARMIVASYLTKNLLIDWRWGERYFATKLIDYDPAQNNGGWQWSASVGTDPRPLRIFNPYTQATNYDPEALYIKKWVPELQHVDARKLSDGKTQDFSSLTKDYPAPIQDQKVAYHRTMEVYKTAKERWREEKVIHDSI